VNEIHGEGERISLSRVNEIHGEGERISLSRVNEIHGEGEPRSYKPVNITSNKETVKEPKKNITTPPENFSELRLTEEQGDCFEWAKDHSYWYQVTGSIESFLLVYHKPNGKLKKQYEEAKHLVKPSGVIRNETHKQHREPRKLSPLERVRQACNEKFGNTDALNGEYTIVD
jgi:hypothetical protein